VVHPPVLGTGGVSDCQGAPLASPRFRPGNDPATTRSGWQAGVKVATAEAVWQLG
jgi:hypothetical protein